MKTETIVASIIGVVVGIIITGFSAGLAVNNNYTGMMNVMGMDMARIQPITNSHATMSMAEMTEELKNKQGDEFDKSFIEMMISHHEGAIAMADLVPSRAKHDEIKELGTAVISAQSKEITDMKQWQKDWGYTSDEMMNMMHGNN